MQSPGSARVQRDSRPSDRSPWHWLLVVPLLFVLVPPLYDHRGPRLGGIPFFYWYQLATIVVGVGCTYTVYRKTRTGTTRRKGH